MTYPIGSTVPNDHDPARSRCVLMLLQLAAWLAARPDMPVPKTILVTAHLAGSAEDLATIARIGGEPGGAHKRHGSTVWAELKPVDGDACYRVTATVPGAAR